MWGEDIFVHFEIQEIRLKVFLIIRMIKTMLTKYLPFKNDKISVDRQERLEFDVTYRDNMPCTDEQ